MNDYEAILDYISTNVPPGPIGGIIAGPGQPTFIRDLQQYYRDKKTQATTATKLANVQLMKHDFFNQFTLNYNGAGPSALNNQQLALYGCLLTMSILRAYKRPRLQEQYVRLRNLPEATLQKELTKLLGAGDETQSFKFPLVTFKNFASAQGNYLSEAESAYGLTVRMLEAIHHEFVVPKAPLKGTRLADFQRYFGSPTAQYAGNSLPFDPTGGLFTSAANVTALAVVKRVLGEVANKFLKQTVKIYYGGHVIKRSNFAYVSSNLNPVHVHLGQLFFVGRRTHGRDSQAGTMIHELTHAFSDTDDHEYGQPDSVNLVGTNVQQALTNADNYQYFIEDAFWPSVQWKF
jgi:hypothetical protein